MKTRIARPRMVLLLPCAIAALSASACELLVSFTIDRVQPVADASNDTSTPPIDPCGPLPERPPFVGEDRTPSLDPILFAPYLWGFESNGSSELCEQPGFNIDGRNTGGPNCDVDRACAQRPTGVTTRVACDDTDGIDNVAGPIFREVRAFPGAGAVMDELDVQTYLSHGTFNLLFQLADYNGTPNDEDVTLSLFGSSGIEGVEKAGASIDEIRLLDEVWDGGQSTPWVVDRDSVTVASAVLQSRWRSVGFVKDGVLVVPTMQVGFRFPGLGTNAGAGLAAFTSARFMAKIVRDGNRFKFTHGRLAASYSSSAFLATIGGIKAGDVQYCEPNSSTYALVRNVFCGSVDLPGGTGNDPNAFCNNVSVAFSIAAVQSSLALEDAGPDEPLRYKIGPSAALPRPPCPDDAGTVWCDDCAWEKADRCDAGPPAAATDAGDASDAPLSD